MTISTDKNLNIDQGGIYTGSDNGKSGNIKLSSNGTTTIDTGNLALDASGSAEGGKITIDSASDTSLKGDYLVSGLSKSGSIIVKSGGKTNLDGSFTINDGKMKVDSAGDTTLQGEILGATQNIVDTPTTGGNVKITSKGSLNSNANIDVSSYSGNAGKITLVSKGAFVDGPDSSYTAAGANGGNVSITGGQSSDFGATNPDTKASVIFDKIDVFGSGGTNAQGVDFDGKPGHITVKGSDGVLKSPVQQN